MRLGHLQWAFFWAALFCATFPENGVKMLWLVWILTLFMEES